MSKFWKVIAIIVALCLAATLLAQFRSNDKIVFEEDPCSDPTAGTPQLMTITMDGREYQYLSNMTFAEFVESDYCTDRGDMFIDSETNLLGFQGNMAYDSYGPIYGDNLMIGIENLSFLADIPDENDPPIIRSRQTMTFEDKNGNKYSWSYEPWMRYADFLASKKYDSLGFGYDPQSYKVRLDGRTFYTDFGEATLGTPCMSVITYTKKMISFKVEGISYTCEPGMTWRDFCNSAYNTDLALIADSSDVTSIITNQQGNLAVMELLDDYPMRVIASDIIQPGGYYIMADSYSVNINGEFYEFDVGMTWDDFYEKYPQCAPEPEGPYGGGMEQPGPSA